MFIPHSLFDHWHNSCWKSFSFFILLNTCYQESLGFHLWLPGSCFLILQLKQICWVWVMVTKWSPLGFSFECPLLLKYKIANNHSTWLPRLIVCPLSFIIQAFSFSWEFSSLQIKLLLRFGDFYRENMRKNIKNPEKWQLRDNGNTISDACVNLYGWYVSYHEWWEVRQPCRSSDCPLS